MVSVSVVLARDRLPTAEAWQRAIHELGLPLRLDPDVAPASLEGMWPVTFKGHGTGFEYVVDGNPDPPEGLPDSSTVLDEIRVTLISRSAVESRAAVVAAAALATASDGRVYDDADQRVYGRHQALLWARQVVAEDDTVDAAAQSDRIEPVMDRQYQPSVSADWADDGLMAIKIQTAQLELNVYVTRSELGQIEQVLATDARNHRSHRIGTILEAPAWWCIDREADLLYILGGRDDETWDVGATLPLATLEAIRAEVAAAEARG